MILLLQMFELVLLLFCADASSLKLYIHAVHCLPFVVDASLIQLKHYLSALMSVQLNLPGTIQIFIEVCGLPIFWTQIDVDFFNKGNEPG